MTLATCFQKVLDKNILGSRKPCGSFVLREKGVMKVEVSGLAADGLVVRLSRIGSLSGVRNGPWKRGCDYMVISRVAESTRVLFVELKRTLTEKPKGLEQLRRSLPLLKYLCSLCRIECGADPKQLKIRYVLIAKRGNPRFDKQPVRQNGTPQKKQHKEIKVDLHIVETRVGFSRLWGE